MIALVFSIYVSQSKKTQKSLINFYADNNPKSAPKIVAFLAGDFKVSVLLVCSVNVFYLAPRNS